jgi:tetratricopeptide (TPR) repeat protein
MPPPRFHGQIIIAAILTALLAAAGGIWWLCERSDTIAFLPARPGAEWIIYSQPPETAARRAYPVRATFKRAFRLDAPPVHATLTIRAFKNANVSVNGHEVGNLKCDGKNWKSPSTASIAGLLQAGTNDIAVCVTNSFGPPALWLRLQAGTFLLGSDESWQVSLAGAPWQKAHRVSLPVTIPGWSPLYDGRRTSDSVRRVWPELAFFCVAALGLIWGVNRWLRRPAASADSHQTKWIYLLLAVIVIARSALFINDMPGLPRLNGFDAAAHEEYIAFIQEKHTLPLAGEGWEMHQPPLYYLGSAMLMNICGFTAGQDESVIPLRAVNGVLGLIHCWLALLCLRLLFPKNLPAQVVGLLVAAFLPPNLYLSQYVTNEPLAGLLVTTAFYFFLRALQSEEKNPWLYPGIGLALGAAMLSKLSAVLAVPVFLMALGLRLVAQKNHSPRGWLRSVGVVALACAVTSGWYYGRVWMQIGALPLPNWETGLASAWWQDPGFRTSDYYFNFGQTLISPLFSGLHGFGDGIYSTLWGDGLISGRAQLVFRPPWNYDLMNAGYLISMAITVLALLGLAVAIKKFILKNEPEWFFMPGLIFMFAIGIIFLTLRGPWLAHVKAFYAIPALVPFSALIATGWSWLAQKNRSLRMALWVVVVVWTFTAYTTYWIRTDNFETWRSRAIAQLQQQRFTTAIESISRALQLNPDDPDSHRIMAWALNHQNQPGESIRQYDAALSLRPDSPDTLNDLAKMLAKGEKNDAGRAVSLAERVCNLTGYRQPKFIETLAAAYTAAGRFDEAISTAEKGCDLSSETGQTNLLQKNQEALTVGLNNLAWRLATSPDPKVRDGTRAVELARRACELTHYQKTIYLGTLAAAHAEAGRFDDAIATAQKACAIASESGEQDLLKKNQELLFLYRAHQPYRETTIP